jgi:hypothetical protein
VLPKEFILEQNFPNPFNPQTTINYSLQKSSTVKITVYDILGNKIITLVNEQKDAGKHSVKFDGSNKACGLYFYCIEAGSFTDIKKFVLMKQHKRLFLL